MEKKVNKRYKLSEPNLYPDLRSNLDHLETDDNKIKEMSKYSLNLLKYSEVSVYKLLYNK
jgi:hypothetical protein